MIKDRLIFLFTCNYHKCLPKIHAYKRISSRCVQNSLYDHHQVFFVFVPSHDVTSKIGKKCAERWQWHEQIFQDYVE